MKVHVLHIGVGRVGKTLLRQVKEQDQRLRQSYDLELVWCGFFGRSSGVFNPKGFLDNEWQDYPAKHQADILTSIDNLPMPFVVIDTTASEDTNVYLSQALQKGGAVILANKKPLAGSLQDFDQLYQSGHSKLLFETTVGAGLPVISSLQGLLGVGDQIKSIRGCFSGTLGFIFSELDKGSKFSSAVVKAKELGYTEPDPRDDLSGMDVARKALILARVMGKRFDIQDIALKKLYPDHLQEISLPEFMDRLPELDDQYSAQVQQAKKTGKVLRYVASVGDKKCQVGLETVDKTSDIGSLKGPDNIVVFKTKYYQDSPLVIKGPGAGLEVTAAGVLDNLITAARLLG